MIQNVYIYRNVRFGANPIRFGPSSYSQSVQNNFIVLPPIVEPTCIQVDPTKIKNPSEGQGGRKFVPETVNQTENCFFLDIYVPANRDPTKLLSVIVWFYNDAFIFGSKHSYETEAPFYIDQSMLHDQSEKIIFVAGNYRFDAFEWLTDTYMKFVGQPNAGLYDQAFILQWVHDYIGSVDGNKSNVSAWGQSAGADSILHHLVRINDTESPHFNKTFLQNPVFEWQWDRNETMNNYFQTFSNLSQCDYQFDINCLRTQTIQNLTQSNQQLFDSIAQTELFSLGPSVDGTWLTDLPAVLFAQSKWSIEFSFSVDVCWYSKTNPGLAWIQ